MAENYDNGVKWTRADILTKKDSTNDLLMDVHKLFDTIESKKPSYLLEEFEQAENVQTELVKFKKLLSDNLEVLNQELSKMMK